MNKYLSILIGSCVLLVSTPGFADTDKRSSGRKELKCMRGGEAACDIAWEGQGLFNIEASAHYAFIPIWDTDLDLQQAYLCCSSDDTRKNLCTDKDKFNKGWVTWDHCSSYVTKFFDNENTSWAPWARKLNQTNRNPNSAAADALARCAKSSDDSWANWGDYILKNAFQVVDVLTVVDLPFAAGSFFLKKVAAREALTAFADVEKKYLLEDVTEFTAQDIRDEIASNLSEWVEAKYEFINYMDQGQYHNLTYTGDSSWLATQRKTAENLLPNGWNTVENTVGDTSIASPWVRNEFEAKAAEQGRKSLFTAYDNKVFTYLSMNLEDIATRMGDEKMLLPETREAINKEVVKRWREIERKTIGDLDHYSLIPDIDDDGLPYPESEAEHDWNILKNQWYRKDIEKNIIPFKDVTTDYTVPQSSVESVQGRFGRIAEVRSTGEGNFEKNSHALKMGYWDRVKDDRLSKEAASAADTLKEQILPQIDDSFVGVVYRADGEAVVTPAQSWANISADRMQKVDRDAYQDLLKRAKRDAFVHGVGEFGTEGMTYMTDQASEGCIYAIFDTLRDNTQCLWNTTEGNLCDN